LTSPDALRGSVNPFTANILLKVFKKAGDEGTKNETSINIANQGSLEELFDIHLIFLISRRILGIFLNSKYRSKWGQSGRQVGRMLV